MSYKIVTEYPFGLILVCILLALAYSFFLYRKDSSFEDAGKWKVRIMALFRFLAVFLISFFLLSPLVKSLKQHLEKPLIIFAQDNSASVVINRDSAFYRNDYPGRVNSFIKNLSQDYEVRSYSFGEDLNKDIDYSFDKKYSDFSKLFSEINNRYANRNVGALVFASDGLYNKGISPIYAGMDINCPVYSVALGDTTCPRDIILSHVNYNKIAFLGNKFPVQVFADIKQLQGINTQLKVLSNNKLEFTKNINVTTDDYTETVNIELEADKTGIRRYTIVIEPDNREITEKNNSLDIVIDILENKQKILLLSNSPHPDIAAIKSVLELNRNYQVESFSIKEFKRSIIEYNLVILHQIPSATRSATQLLSDIFKNGIPVVFILGGQSSVRNINNLRTGIQIRQYRNSFEETQAEYNDKFALFGVDEDIQQFIEKVPPLVSPFGDYKTGNATNVLFYQKIKNITTAKPLICFLNMADNKVGIITGEGLWRWKIYNYLYYSSHDHFNTLINKLVQYMALKVNKDKFIVNTKKVFDENEPVIFEAELYNENYELVNDPEVTITIINPEGKEFPFICKRTSRAYKLTAGMFPVGDYSYRAEAEFGQKNYLKTGKFSVLTVNVEENNTVADHHLLYQLSSNSNGKMYYPDEFEKLEEDIKSNKNIVPLSYTDKSLTDLVSFRWLFLVIILFISAEWFMRKYYGSY